MSVASLDLMLEGALDCEYVSMPPIEIPNKTAKIVLIIILILLGVAVSLIAVSVVPYTRARRGVQTFITRSGLRPNKARIPSTAERSTRICALRRLGVYYAQPHVQNRGSGGICRESSS